MSFSFPTHPLTISERRAHGVVTLHLHGELDLEGAQRLQAHLAELQRTLRGRLTIDLRGLEFLESAGIAVLVAAETYARRDGWVLEIRPGRPEVQRVFEVCGLVDHLPFTAEALPTSTQARSA